MTHSYDLFHMCFRPSFERTPGYLRQENAFFGQKTVPEWRIRPEIFKSLAFFSKISKMLQNLEYFWKKSASFGSSKMLAIV